MKSKNVLVNTGVLLLAVFIPVLLFFSSFQSKQYIFLQKEVKSLHAKQYELIESNNRLITNISILSNPERIGELAETTLGMRKAKPEEIMRIEVKK